MDKDLKIGDQVEILKDAVCEPYLDKTVCERYNLPSAVGYVGVINDIDSSSLNNLIYYIKELPACFLNENGGWWYSKDQIRLFKEESKPKEPKFKEGDKVKILSDAYANLEAKSGTVASHNYKSAVGIIGTIDCRLKNGCYSVRNLGKKSGFCWAYFPEQLELVSCSPKLMNFSKALKAMKKGKTVTRKAFREARVNDFPDYSMKLDMSCGNFVTPDCSNYPFLSSDIFAKDWYIVNERKK